MVERKEIPVTDDYAIAIVTECMADGQWAVVASVKHRREGVESTRDLPVSKERFATQADAEAHGERQARAWLERNEPHAA
jgi:hypothetical protein